MFSELWSEIRYRLRMIFRRAAVEREIDEEMRFHLDREAEKLRRAGAPPEEAMRGARVVFGGVSRIKDETRDAHGIAFLEHVVQDLRYALRQLRAHPLFTATVVATLALGVGVNAAMFGLLDRMLFRAPSYLVDPPSVSRVYLETSTPDGKRVFDHSFAYRHYQDVARWNRSLSNVAVFAYRSMAVGEGDETRGRVVGVVSADYFAFFDARPALGRFFDASEDRAPNGEAVGVLGYGFWQSEFGGRRDVLGTAVRVGTVVVRVIGVAPPGFEGVSDQRAPAIFIPVTTFAASRDKSFDKNYGWSWLDILVRRKPGVTADAAGADLTSAFVRSWNAEREMEPGLPPASVSRPVALAAPTQLARGPLAGADAQVARWVGGVALVVLLIACANVANLLLARATRRRREMAVRRAIGGSRRRLIQQMLTETLVLAAFGSTAGLAAAAVSAGAFRRIIATTSDAWPVVSDGRTLAFALGLTLFAALCSGIVPAVVSGTEDLAGCLKAGMRDTAYRHSGLRKTLLVFQTALSVILLVGAGLFIRSLQHVRELPLGYDVDHIVYVESSMRGVSLKPVEQTLLAERLRDAAGAVPGVVSTSQLVSVPFYSGESRSLRVQGVDSIRKLGRFQLQSGSTEYFKTMGTRILRGRAFDGQDRETTPRVVVISESMGKALWKGADPIGKCIRISADTAPCTTVIGIAEDTRARNITSSGEFMYYLPISQYVSSFGGLPMLAMFVRVNGTSDGFTEAIRSRLQRVMPDPAYVTARPFHELIDPTMRSWTSGARMFATFGALALLLAAIGLYAVVAFTVSQRTQELGVRIALGALPRDVLRLVVGDGLRVTLLGVVIGAVVALGGTRALTGLLFGVSARDPMIYGTVALLLVVVGALASAVPAARAARVDPNTALRAE
jgi:putative ABC transport system permease protein